MNDEICWLVTVLYCGTLIQCAIKVKRDALPYDCIEYPMEPENRKRIHALLPLHVQTCGPIVEVQEIFEVHVDSQVDKSTESPNNCTIDSFEAKDNNEVENMRHNEEQNETKRCATCAYSYCGSHGEFGCELYQNPVCSHESCLNWRHWADTQKDKHARQAAFLDAWLEIEEELSKHQNDLKLSFGLEYSDTTDWVADLTPRRNHPSACQYGKLWCSQGPTATHAINRVLHIMRSEI